MTIDRVPRVSIRIKSVFSFLRQLITRHCPHLLLRVVLLSAGRETIDRYFLPKPSPQKQTRRMHAAAAVER